MFKKLLVPLDHSPLAEQALGYAAAVARAADAEIYLVLVHQPMPFAGFDDEPWDSKAATEELEYLEIIAAELTSGSSVPVTCAVLRGETVEMICKYARDVAADLIVMTSHGRTGISRAWFGSVADGILRHAPAPVLTLRPVEGKSRLAAAHHLFKRVLVPLDGSTLAAAVLPSALDLARCHGAKVTLLGVAQPVPLIIPELNDGMGFPPFIPDQMATDRIAAELRSQLKEIAGRWHKDGGVEIDTEVISAGQVAQAIIDFAAGHSIDAIAMSTHGRGASRLFLGSVADKILRGTEVPTLLFRPTVVVEGTGSPVLGQAGKTPELLHA